MRFLEFDGDHGTVLGEKIEHVGFLKGIRQLVNVKIGKVGLGFGVVSFSFGHLLVRSLVLGDAEAVRVLLHEVSLLSWLLAFLVGLISLISKNNVELIDNLLLSAHRV